ncbi:unnamed protein product [Cyprideis torosa]|uniref:Uncharacterized protein n=1 Tax=Cyprideis torosa TaxID=163714 RepID=A0A7R8WCZ6_9CRUS|nr:unnamed protein product [Cyprideis torosa]CAG0894068.1 unnamed protein product [Cyprideis torosa]
MHIVGNPLTEEDYSFEELQKDFDDHRAFGFVFGTFFALNQMGDAADMPSLDDMEEDMVKKMDEFIEEGKKKPMAKPMLDKIIELVNEAIKDGVIC